MPIEVFFHSFVPVGFGMAFIAVTLLRSVISASQIGKSPFVIDRRDPVLGFVGGVFVLVVLIQLAYFGAIAMAPGLETMMGRVPRGNESGWRFASVVIMTSSLVWLSIAQFCMGRSWRVGICQAEILDLRTNGPFAVSRNPIFVGMLGLSVGLVLWSPAVVPFVALTATYLALEIQVRVEEVYLERTIGEPYVRYRMRTPRWL